MQLIEGQGEQLVGVLPKSYTDFFDEILSELLPIFNNSALDEVGGDIIGRIYEYMHAYKLTRHKEKLLGRCHALVAFLLHEALPTWACVCAAVATSCVFYSLAPVRIFAFSVFDIFAFLFWSSCRFIFASFLPFPLFILLTFLFLVRGS
ncbi:hypothetical protein [Fannyhessea vaginae]|uniref:hypothetical protein n=1 Tax=Fannyhessea vaginae TaxID=82135 RepID=UPI00076FA2B2|nr:hypothetical protein [Fannyhessea vaginae]KXG90612.1 hypothetical protein HMPREF3232_00540 [Fannyhessea vaginae]